MGPERKCGMLAAGMMLAALGLTGVSAETSREAADRLAGPSPGTVTGKVMNSRGEALPGARVTLRRGEASWIAETDGEGVYCFCRVPPARDYTLRVEKEGFAGAVEPDLYVGGRKVSVLNLVLRPQADFLPSGRKGESDE